MNRLHIVLIYPIFHLIPPINVAHLFQLMNKSQYIIIWKLLHFIWVFSVFNLVSFSFSGPTQDMTLYLAVMSLQTLLLYDSFSDFFLFLLTFTVLRCTSQAFCRLLFDWDWSGIFKMNKLELLIGKGSSQRPHVITIMSYQTNTLNMIFQC